MSAGLPITGNEEADHLLVDNPLALVMGMMLDQQVPMERAFMAPYVLRQRLGGSLDAGAIAAMDPDELETQFKERPALHRFPGSMAKRAHALCRHLVDEYTGDASQVWAADGDAGEVFRRIRALPGYGQEKAQIFLALLGKRLGRAPAGWEEFAGRFADSTPRSVADIDSAESLERVREFKRAMKAQGKSKAD